MLSWSPRSTLLRRPNRKEDEEGLSCSSKKHLSCLSCPAPFGAGRIQGKHALSLGSPTALQAAGLFHQQHVAA